jgi:hypothetical protein
MTWMVISAMDAGVSAFIKTVYFPLWKSVCSLQPLKKLKGIQFTPQQKDITDKYPLSG